MKNIILFLALSMLPAICRAQSKTTIREEMERLKHEKQVSFVYESSLPIDAEYSGMPLVGNLKQRLRMLFHNSGITFRQKGDYVMLFQEDAKRREKKRVKNQMKAQREQKHEEMEAEIFRSDSLDEVVVRGDMHSRVLSTQTGKRTLSSAELNTEFSVLSSPDLLKTLQRTSGVQEGVELTSGMHVHGGNNDENLFLIDRTPVYGNSHAIGLFSAFNTDVIRQTDFYKSGFPARFGGRLSSVTDVHTIDGDSIRGHGLLNIGLIDGRLMFQGPIKLRRERQQIERGERQGYSTTYVLGVRRTWMDFVTVPAIYIHNKNNKDNKMDFRYFLHDINAKLTHRLSARSSIYLSLYSSKDYLKIKKDMEDENNTDNENLKISYGNINIAAGWKGMLGKTLTADFCALFSRYRSHYEYNTLYQKKGSSDAYSSVTKRLYNSSVNDFGTRAELHWRPSMRHDIHFGGDIMQHVFRPQTRQQYDSYGTNITPTDTSNISVAGTQYATEANVYVEDEMHIGERWNLNIGMRAGLFRTRTANGSEKTFRNIDPRVALKYQASHSTSLKFSLSEMTQNIHCISNSYLSLPTDYWVPTTERLHPMRSGQLAVGAYYQPTRHWLLSLEGYYKESNRLLQYANWLGLEPPADAWDTKVSEGRGRFYGVEADVRYQDKRLKIDAAYTLSWNRRRFDDFFPEWYYDKFDNRHKFNITMRCRLSKGTHFYAGWIYRTGNRMTAPTQYADMPDLGEGRSQGFVYERPNNIVLPAYHRLDLGFDIHHKTKRGHERVWNWSIYNAYCHFNTLFVNVKYDETTGRIRAKAKGYIPIIPSFSYTIKF